MQIVPFKAEHLKTLKLQSAQSYFAADMLDPDYAKALEQGTDSFTAIDGDKIIGCAGILTQWAGRGLAWALLSQEAGPYLARLVKSIRRYLDLSELRRIEAYSEADFPQGIRMLRLLGFQCEGYAEAYTPNGNDCYLYARVRRAV